jgi:hypothetical protein
MFPRRIELSNLQVTVALAVALAAIKVVTPLATVRLIMSTDKIDTT